MSTQTSHATGELGIVFYFLAARTVGDRLDAWATRRLTVDTVRTATRELANSMFGPDSDDDSPLVISLQDLQPLASSSTNQTGSVDAN